MTNEKRVWGKKTQTVKLIHAFEMLKKIDQADGQDKIKLLKEYGIKAPLNYILSLNFRKDINLDLPEGMPPLDPKEMDGVTHPDMMGNLATNVHRLKYCMVGSNIKAFKKEEIFIQVLLSCPLEDAEIICSAKDKALEELYPTITAEFVKSVFPNYVN